MTGPTAPRPASRPGVAPCHISPRSVIGHLEPWATDDARGSVHRVRVGAPLRSLHGRTSP
jgi:hypothetical protein